MKLFSLIALAMMSTAAFSQTCYVDMVHKTTNRVVRSFTAYGDANCMEGMLQCRKSIRLDFSSNPQYPNGSLDCIAARRGNPAPNPYPTPNPYPNPNPQPYPNPTPNPNPYPNPSPYPDPYGTIELTSLTNDLVQYVSTYQNKYNFYKVVGRNVNDLSLNRLLDTCNSANTWERTAFCVEDGMRYIPRMRLDTYTAKNIAIDGCNVTSTYADEARCLEAATRYFPSLSPYSRSCLVSGYSSTTVNCLKNILRNYL